MANSSITIILVTGVCLISISCIYAFFNLIVQRISASKSDPYAPSSTRRSKRKKEITPSPRPRVSAQHTHISFTNFLVLLLFLSIIPALYVHLFEHKEVMSTPPPVESPSTPTILEWPKTSSSKEGRSWNIIISPESSVGPASPKKHSSNKQRSYSYRTQKAFVIELDSFSRKEQANMAAKSFKHPTKVINIGNEFKLVIGDFNTLIEADEYLQKSELEGFIYQIRLHHAVGRKV